MRQNPVSPRSQFSQKPQAILNGMQTRSPSLTRSTALPISMTVPRFSCPKILPGSIFVRPSYICRSEPNVRGRDFHKDIGCFFNLGIRDVFDDYVARTFINDCFHDDSSFLADIFRWHPYLSLFRRFAVEVLVVGLRLGAGMVDNAVPMIRRRIERIELQWDTAGVDAVSYTHL